MVMELNHLAFSLKVGLVAVSEFKGWITNVAAAGVDSGDEA